MTMASPPTHFNGDWQAVYDAYPVNDQYIWLNNCGTVPAGTHVVEAIGRHMAGYAQKGVFTEVAVYSDILARIKAILSGLLVCRSDEVTLVHHTAEGMNFISHGLALDPGDEIVLLENEYPSNVYPWQHWKEKGVALKTAPMADTPGAFFDGLCRTLSERTRVVAVSAVHWCTGMPMPLDRIGGICREKSIDLVVDGAQGVGMQPLDVNRANIAYMAFPAWKWLTGPLGLGALYVRRDKLDELKPVFIGTGSVVRDQEYLPYKSELKPTADRFILSTPNYNDWVYFLASLEYLAGIGFETVRHRLMELGRHLADRLRASGWQVMSDRFKDDPTAIVVCEKPGVSALEVVGRLQADGVMAASRLGRVRFAPHIYISPDRLDEAVRRLDNAATPK